MEHRHFAWLAWHIEALARTKRLPDIRKLAGEPLEPQSPDEMLANLEAFVRRHNAAQQKLQRIVEAVEAEADG